MPNTHTHTWQFSKWIERPAMQFDTTITDSYITWTMLQFVCECGAVKHVQPFEDKSNA